MSEEPQPTKPEDFDDYWTRVDDELAQVEARPELEFLPRQSTGDFKTYALRLTSIGPYRIFGFYCVPQGEGPFPAILQTPRYGSVNHISDYNDRLRYVCLQIMHRGQRLADVPFSAAYPGLLTHDIDQPERYIYRAIVADCLRAAEFLLSRDEVDPERVAILGDDLALITAARRSGFSDLQYGTPLLNRAAEARHLAREYPLEELNDYLRTYPEKLEAVERSLGYVNPVFHAPNVTAETVLSIGDDDSADGMPFMAPLAEALGGPVEFYKIMHQGGADRDWLDRRLAARFGVEPLPRYRTEYE